MSANLETRLSSSGAGRDPAKFCPHFGCLPNTSVVLAGQLESLLASRLKIATTVIFCGLGAFVVRNLLEGLSPQTGGLRTVIPQAIVTLLVAAISVLLYLRKSEWTIAQLRICEILAFGLTAASLGWLQWCVVRYCPPESLAAIADAYPARAAVPWILLIQIYGLFVPNTWQRAAAVIGLLAIVPLAVAALSGLQEPLLQAALARGGASAMVLWLAIAAVAGVYGSHRFSAMRQETFDARSKGLYSLLRKLGEGGMGEVYLAEHQLLKRPCAMKLIRADRAGDSKTVARFEAEVQATARLSHPNTVAIYDYGITDDGSFFYVMEFLPGMSLEDLVVHFGPLPPERVVYLLRQVCSALAEAHAASLIHRDIKPGNIFAAERGGIYDVAKLLDFGLVKSVAAAQQSTNLTMDGAFIGSPLYSPPETIVGNGPTDGRGDIYSLGATAYHLLTGQPVFQGDNPLQVVVAHTNETPVALRELRPEIPAELETIVLRCLEKDPTDRFADVVALDDELARCPLPDRWDHHRAKAWWTEFGEQPLAPTPRTAETVTQIGETSGMI